MKKFAVISALLALTMLFTCFFSACGKKYETLADFINSDELQSQLGSSPVEGMNISFEAENENTVRINYDLTTEISDALLETAKQSYQGSLEDKETASALKEAYTSIHRLFPSMDIRMHVVFKDAKGTLLAEKTYTGADFE